MSTLLTERAPVSGDEAPGRSAPTPEQVRALLTVAFRPTAVVVATITALVGVVMVAAHTELSVLSGAVAASWLAVHQVPLTIDGATLGVLPLVPTAGLVWLVGHGCARAARDMTTRRDLVRLLAAAVAGPFVVTIVALAVVKDASGVVALQPPNTLKAFAWVIGLHAAAAAGGIALSRGRWREFVGSCGAPPWFADAVVAAVRGVGTLLIGATVVALVSMFAEWSAMSDLLGATDGIVGKLGLVLLSLAYLPNVVLGTTAVVTGSAAHIGAGSVSVFAVVGGPVPGLPVLAAVPSGAPASWWSVLLIVPVVAAIRLGRDCARIGGDRWTVLRATITAAGLGSILLVLLALAAGGDLGSFGHLGTDVPILGAAVVGWFALIGSATAMVLRRAQPDTEPESAEPVAAEPVPEPKPIAAPRVQPVAYDAEIVESDEPVAQIGDPDEDIVDAEVVAETDLPSETGTRAD